MGYKHVKDYVEGKVGWMRSGLPTERSADELTWDEGDSQPPWWRRILGQG